MNTPLTSFFSEMIIKLVDSETVMCPNGHMLKSKDAFRDEESYGDVYFCSEQEAQDWDDELVRLARSN